MFKEAKVDHSTEPGSKPVPSWEELLRTYSAGDRNHSGAMIIERLGGAVEITVTRLRRGSPSAELEDIRQQLWLEILDAAASGPVSGETGGSIPASLLATAVRRVVPWLRRQNNEANAIPPRGRLIQPRAAAPTTAGRRQRRPSTRPSRGRQTPARDMGTRSPHSPLLPGGHPPSSTIMASSTHREEQS